MSSDQTIQDLWSILHTAGPGRHVEVELNEHKGHYDLSPERILKERRQWMVISDEEYARCIECNTLWVLRISAAQESLALYGASTLDALVAIYRAKAEEPFIEKLAASVKDLQILRQVLETPYMNLSISRDAHTAFQYTTFPDKVDHINIDIRTFLEFPEDVDFARELSEEEVRLYEAEHLWHYHIYPKNPIGSYAHAAPSLRELLSDLPPEGELL